MTEQPQDTLNTWAIVELMGHQRMAGFVTTTTIAGGSFLRIDVPEVLTDPAFTRYVSPQAIFAINPTTEALARKAAFNLRPEPVRPWELVEPHQPALVDKRSRDDIDPEEREIF